MVLTDLVFPPRCAGCGALGPSPCEACVEALHPLDEISVGTPVDRCLVLLDYDDLARRLIAKLKYGGVRTSVGWFARAMADRVVASGESIQAVTWVPAAPANRRRRGFDQGEALARPIGSCVAVPAQALLFRSGRSTQTGRRRADRLDGPELHSSAPGLAGQTILVVDDVATTGATLRRAAEALTRRGASRGVGVGAAHSRWLQPLVEQSR